MKPVGEDTTVNDAISKAYEDLVVYTVSVLDTIYWQAEPPTSDQARELLQKIIDLVSS